MNQIYLLISSLLFASVAWSQTTTVGSTASSATAPNTNSSSTATTTQANPGIGVGTVTTAPTLPNPAPGTGSTNSSVNSNNDVVSIIRRDLRNDPRISTAAENVSIINQNGAIILRGQVPSRSDEEDIISRAKSLSGNANVNSELTITPRF